MKHPRQLTSPYACVHSMLYTSIRWSPPHPFSVGSAWQEEVWHSGIGREYDDAPAASAFPQ
jgi:hypothetical protein